MDPDPQQNPGTEPEPQPTEPAAKGQPEPDPNTKSDDDIMVQIEMNVNRMNEIQDEVNKSSPFVSDIVPTATYMEKWQGNKFYDSFTDLTSRFTKIRELRRDGNCFYRALFFQLWEHYLQNFNDETVKADYNRVKKILESSKTDLVQLGYDDIAVDDFYQTFYDEFKNIETVAPQGAEKHNQMLQKLFCSEDWGPYMIMYT